MSKSEKSFEELLAASSFGTPGAVALRKRTPDHVAADIVARSERLSLNLFINSALHSGKAQRAHVEEPGLRLYVRLSTHRLIRGYVRSPVLEIADVNAVEPGKGAFKALIKRIRTDYPALPIYVENVISPRFREGLERMGFVLLRQGAPDTCFWWEP